MDNQKYNLSSPTFLQDPYPILSKMREEAPVYWSEDLKVWMLTRYEDVFAAFKDERLSSDRTAVTNKRMEVDPTDDKPPEIIKDFVRILSQMMFVKGGKEHQRLRKPMNQAFRDEIVGSFSAFIEETADHVAQRLKQQTSFDVITDFSAAFSLTLLCRVMGVPIKDQEDIRQWTMDFATFLGGPKDMEHIQKAGKAANQAVCNFEIYFRNLIRTPIEQIENGLIKEFVKVAQEVGLNETEIISQFVMLTAAGNAPVIDQLGNTVRLILSQPDIYHQIRQDPSLVKAVTLEGLRYDPATFIAHRYVLEDVVIRGQTIRQGDVIFLGIGAANRDPEVFEHPDIFDIHRPNNAQHITFGSGAHVCLGTKLAMQELEVGLTTLLCNLPELEIEDKPIARYDTFAFRGYNSLRVKYKN